MTAYTDFHARSVDDPESFWRDQIDRIDWHDRPTRMLDYDKPPFARWFVGGTTNLCHNAIDLHVGARGDQAAIVHVSSELLVDGQPTDHVMTYRELHARVNEAAATLLGLGVGRGDRVLIYMPMIPEALVAMYACLRIGAIHSVVFGGFASHSLATRIDDATPKVIVSADAGSRSGKVVEYKPLLDAAIDLAVHKPSAVLLVDRKLAPFRRVEGRDLDWRDMLARHVGANVPCVWLESSEPSYILYTSGTTGRPKGVQRDTGGYAVALATSMQTIFQGSAGDTMFTASDIGWVVGHSYIVYAPLLVGMTTVLYEGTPIRPDGAVWWSIVERHRVNLLFSAPTAIRVLKKHDAALLTRHDLSSLRTLFLAGEPLDEPTASWITQGIGKPVLDNYWQTESGWPIISVQRGIPGNQAMPVKLGSPGRPSYGYRVQVIDESSGGVAESDVKGVITIEAPLPPGCMSTVWGDDARFVSTYFTERDGRWSYSTFDWGIRDADGYLFVLGRTDDVINTAGHRLGTREIEETISAHASVAEVAVVGIADPLKGQIPIAFVILRDAEAASTDPQARALEADIMKLVDTRLGAVARPSRIHFVSGLPKTRSGKLLRRAMQAICEGRDAGDLTTIEDPQTLVQIRQAAGVATVTR
ncbi:propionate--CoA ligase [soil metagenome]